MLVNKVIPGFYNGISQQPPGIRLDTQCELEINGYNSLVSGMVKRPPTRHIANLSSNVASSSFLHMINRDSSEKYQVIITGNATEPMEVYTLTGTKCTVRYGTLSASNAYTASDTVKTYLTTLGGKAPLDVFRATTVADYTLIANNTVTCEMSGTASSSGASEGIVYIKKGVAGTDYHIYINGSQVATYTSLTTADYDTYKSTTIANNLYGDMAGLSGYTVSLSGSAIRIVKTDGTPFTLTCHDGWGDQAMLAVQKKVQKFTDLPATGFNGFTVEVAGDPNNDFDNYWVKYESAGSSGVWLETTAPGIDNSFDVTTMPHRLVRTGVNQFTFAPCIWEDRKVGDELTASEPSCISSTVNDIFFYRNRLGMLSGENVVLSKVGEFFNFWPSSVTTVLDDDPIDISVSTNEVSTLFHAQPFNASLIVFSDQIQFEVHSASQAFTPRNVVVDTTTHFPTSRSCRPVGAGANIYFTSPKGSFTSLKEFYVQSGSLNNDAADVTAHVPELLPKNISKLASCQAMDTVFCLSPETNDTVYVYKYFWSGDQKQQSAWMTWQFGGTVLNIECIDTQLVLVVKRNGVVCLEAITLESSTTGELNWCVHLDRLTDVQGVYNANLDSTTWTLPYTDTTYDYHVIMANSGNEVEGIALMEGNKIRAAGDYSSGKAHIGKSYEHRYRFTEWNVKAPNSNVAILQGRLICRTLTVYYTDTGYFRIEHTSPGRTTTTKVYTGATLGASLLDTTTLHTGFRRFTVMANASGATLDLVNDSHYPSAFHSASFEGYYTSRSQSL